MGLLQIAKTGNVKDLFLDLRVRSLYSPYFFEKAVLGYTKLTDYFHKVELEAFVGRWADGVTKQWIEWSRAFYKTTTFTLGCSMWVVLPVRDQDTEYAVTKLGISEEDWWRIVKLHDQDVTQLLAFETTSNAEKKVGEIRWHFEENQLFRAVFPDIAYSGTESPWNNSCLKIRRKGYGRRVSEGTFEAIGVGNALQSRHYKIVWEDDLVGKKARDSEVVMQSTIDWHKLLNGAFEKGTQQIRFGVSNRWGFNDLNSYVRENEKDYFFTTKGCWFVNPETGQEEATFPVDGEGKEAYPLDALKKMQTDGSISRHDFACQYENSPIPPGSQEVDRSVIHTYEIEDGQVVCSCGARWTPEQMLRWMHYDPYNAKKTDSKSSPCIVITGTTPDEHVFLLTYFTSRVAYGPIFDKLFQYNMDWKPHKMTYEDVGHQNMTEHHIRELMNTEEMKKKYPRPFPTILPIKTGNKAKELRIRDYLFPYLRRKFSVRKSHLLFFSMLETFPFDVPSHDYDLLDALAQGALVWRFPKGEEAIEEEKKVEKEYVAKLGKPYTHMEVASAV